MTWWADIWRLERIYGESNEDGFPEEIEIKNMETGETRDYKLAVEDEVPRALPEYIEALVYFCYVCQQEQAVRLPLEFLQDFACPKCASVYSVSSVRLDRLGTSHQITLLKPGNPTGSKPADTVAHSETSNTPAQPGNNTPATEPNTELSVAHKGEAK